MKIGFLGIEYFGSKSIGDKIVPSSAHGGFGFVTKRKCEELVKMGHEVHVFVPAPSFDRSNNVSRTIEENGVQIHLYKMTNYFEGSKYLRFIGQVYESKRKIKDLDMFLKDFPVDVFQSEEPYLYSIQAFEHNRNQVLVFQDPFERKDVEILAQASSEYFASPQASIDSPTKVVQNKASMLSIQATLLSERISHISPTSKLLKQLPSLNIYSAAKFISEKVRRMYGTDYLPTFLPNPQPVPSTLRKKSDRPSILWLGRWEIQKRPDIGLEIARNLPDYDFYFVGKSNEVDAYLRVQEALRERYRKYKNIHIMDFVSEEQKFELLDKAWILLNTSAREGLPTSFLEAGVHGECIVSSVDPDGYSSMFGKYVNDGNFISAIRQAVDEEWHLTLGRKAYDYVKKVHETSTVMKQHVGIYEEILEN